MALIPSQITRSLYVSTTSSASPVHNNEPAGALVMRPLQLAAQHLTAWRQPCAPVCMRPIRLDTAARDFRQIVAVPPGVNTGILIGYADAVGERTEVAITVQGAAGSPPINIRIEVFPGGVTSFQTEIALRWPLSTSLGAPTFVDLEFSAFKTVGVASTAAITSIGVIFSPMLEAV